MGKLKNMWISQQEEEEFLMDEERQKRQEAWEAMREAQLERNRLFDQDEIGSEDDETGFDFERDQGARP